MLLLCSLATRLAPSKEDVPQSFRIFSRCQPAHPSVYSPGLLCTHWEGHQGQLSLSTTPPRSAIAHLPPPILLFHVSLPPWLFVFLSPLLCAVLSFPLHSRCLLGRYQPLPGNNPDQFQPVPNTSSQRLHFCWIGPIYHQEKEVAVNHAFILKENWNRQATLPWGKRSVNGTSHQEIPNPIFFHQTLGLRTNYIMVRILYVENIGTPKLNWFKQ